MKKAILFGLTAIVSSVAFAGHGHGHGHGHGKNDDEGRGRSGYESQYSQSYDDVRSCPPGLAKKNNGCMPPGQAKKWNKGQPIPNDMAYSSIPRAQLGSYGLPPPPIGQVYVKTQNDVLLITEGTRMVVEGFSGLLGK